MFNIIREKSHEYLDKQIDKLKEYCDKDSNVAEMVRYIITYSDEMAYSSIDSSDDAKIGRQLIQFIWQISKQDFSNIANRYHFSPSWAYELNHFIGNWIYDDFAFDFKKGYQDQFDFFTSDDGGRWFQNPKILVEAAKSTVEWQNKDPYNRSSHMLFHKVDHSAVEEILKEYAS